MNEPRYYIAYGSNLNTAQMRYRCPSARIVGTAEIHDYRLLFKGSKSGNYLTIEPEDGMKVPVAIWAVTPRDERMLDRYEGFPSFYYKQDFELDVKVRGSFITRHMTAFAYIMHEERELGIPTDTYFGVCSDGYDDFGFDQRILDDAYSYTYINSFRRYHYGN